MKRKLRLSTRASPSPHDAEDPSARAEGVVRFSLFGTKFQVSGDLQLIAELSSYYRPFLADDHGAMPLRIDWRDGACFTDLLPAPVRLHDARLRGAVTTLLVTRALQAAHRDWLVLHGSAIETTDGILLLVGASGSGKTTIARALLDHDPHARLIAEDLLFIDADSGVVMPFPRPAIIKDAAGGGGMEWVSLGGGTSRTLEHWQVTRPDAASLSGARLLLLQSAAPSVPGSGAWRLWVSALPHQIEDLGLPASLAAVLSLDAADGAFPSIRMTREPAAEELAAVVEALEARGCLVLRAGPGQHPGSPTFPDSPAMAPMPIGELLSDLLRHLVRHGSGAMSAGERFLRLGRVFSGTSGWRVTPGGTVGETIATIRLALSGERRP